MKDNRKQDTKAEKAVERALELIRKGPTRHRDVADVMAWDNCFVRKCMGRLVSDGAIVRHQKKAGHPVVYSLPGQDVPPEMLEPRKPEKPAAAPIKAGPETANRKRGLILKAIEDRGPLTRTELASATRLPRNGVRYLADDLVAAGKLRLTRVRRSASPSVYHLPGQIVADAIRNGRKMAPEERLEARRFRARKYRALRRMAVECEDRSRVAPIELADRVWFERARSLTGQPPEVIARVKEHTYRCWSP